MFHLNVPGTMINVAVEFLSFKVTNTFSGEILKDANFRRMSTVNTDQNVIDWTC